MYFRLIYFFIYNIDYLDYAFTLYNSKNNCLYLVYSTGYKSIKFYSFCQELKNANNDCITYFRHAFIKKKIKI